MLCLSIGTSFAQLAGDAEAVQLAQHCYDLSVERNKQMRHKEAASLASRAYTLYDSLVLVHRDSMLYVAQRARTCHQLSLIFYELNQGGKSLRAAQRSLRFYHQAVTIDSLTFTAEANVAKANLYVFMSYGYQEERQNEAALFYAEKALEMRRKLYEVNPDDHIRSLFSALRVKGMALIRFRRFDEAHETFQEAIQVLDECERKWPGQNNFNYQTIYFNIASAYYMDGKYDEALAGNMKVLNLLLNDKTQSKANQYYYLDYVYKYLGNCYWSLAWECYEKNNQNKKCKEMKTLYQKAIDCYTMSVQYNANDMESLSKLQMCNMILMGMEKPRPMINGR